MTYTSEGINTHEISNNDLFAPKLSGRIDLDLFCVDVVDKFSHSAKANTSEAVQ